MLSPGPPKAKTSPPAPPSIRSVPLPPRITSLPPLPISRLLALLPVRLSSPPPAIAFSMVAPNAIWTLRVCPPPSLEAPGLRSIREGPLQPEKSSVSRPPASQIATTGAVFRAKSNAARPASLLNP